MEQLANVWLLFMLNLAIRYAEWTRDPIPNGDGLIDEVRRVWLPRA